MLDKNSQSNIHMNIVYKIHGLVMAMDKEAEDFFHANLSLSYNKFLILFVIGDKCAGTQKEVSDMTNLTEAAVSKQVESLRQSNYLTREENTKDRRQHLLKLTDSGEKILESALNIMHQNTSSFLSTLDDEELQNLNKYLDKLFHSAFLNFKTLKNLQS